MQKRLILLLLMLVILPTAALCLLAVRSLRGWELILQRRMEVGAESAVQAAVSRVDRRLSDDLNQLESVMSDSLRRGYTPDRMAGAVETLKDSHALIGEAYLFMNPWGFVFPQRSDPSADADEELVSALRRETALAEADAPIRFKAGGRACCFRRVTASASLYAGYGVAEAALQEFIHQAISGLSAEGFVLEARGPGLRMASREWEQGEVVVSDSLGGHVGVVRPAADVLERAKPLARAAFEAPFEEFEVLAFAQDAAAMASAGRHEAILNGWGVFVLACGICIGAWVMLHSALQEARRMRARSDFVLGVSHDLRTPLASMRVLAESLYLGRVSSEARRKRFLETILQECERLTQLVERVLFLVRYGQDALVYDRRKEDIESVAREAAQIFCARVPEMQCECPGVAVSVDARPGFQVSGEGPRPVFRVRFEPDLPMVRLDRTALIQVLLNLLDNAHKYGRYTGHAASRMRCPEEDRLPASQASGAGVTDPNGTANAPSGWKQAMALEVRREQRRRHSLARARAWVCIRVSDNGPGIQAKERRRIFRPFYRSPGAEHGNVSGVGLGLALCRHVVRAHGGVITVASRQGEGSVFSVYLPV